MRGRDTLSRRTDYSRAQTELAPGTQLEILNHHSVLLDKQCRYACQNAFIRTLIKMVLRLICSIADRRSHVFDSRRLPFRSTLAPVPGPRGE